MSQLSLGAGAGDTNTGAGDIGEDIEGWDTVLWGRGHSDGGQPGDPPVPPVLGLPRVLARPLDRAHHGHHIRVSVLMFLSVSESGIMQCRGVVNTAVMTTTRQPGGHGGKQSSCRWRRRRHLLWLLFTFATSAKAQGHRVPRLCGETLIMYRDTRIFPPLVMTSQLSSETLRLRAYCLETLGVSPS